MYYPHIFMEGPRKTTNNFVRIAGAPEEVRTDHFPNSSIEH
jgi:hypothetical protein